MFTKKRITSSKQSQKVIHRQKKLRISLLAGKCLQNVHLTKQKINPITTEEGIELKKCVKS